MNVQSSQCWRTGPRVHPLDDIHSSISFWQYISSVVIVHIREELLLVKKESYFYSWENSFLASRPLLNFTFCWDLVGSSYFIYTLYVQNEAENTLRSPAIPLRTLTMSMYLIVTEVANPEDMLHKHFRINFVSEKHLDLSGNVIITLNSNKIVQKKKRKSTVIPS